jgi:hypothetical protein
MPSEREYEQALQHEPGHNEAFLFLRRSYRESGRFDKLVTLYETRAQAIRIRPRPQSSSTWPRKFASITCRT